MTKKVKKKVSPKSRSSSVLHKQSLKSTHSFRENLVSHHEDSVWNEYELDRSGDNNVLGTGVTGQVFRIRRLSNPSAVFAIKQLEIKNLNVRQQKDLETEVSVLKFVNHSHIARLYESFETVGYKVIPQVSLFDSLTGYE